MSRSRPVWVAALAALAVAVLGGLMTDIGPWYRSLRQPAWKPPDWAFGPVWTVIFVLAAASGVIGWRRATSRRQRETLLWLYALNGFLNVFWSLLYFRLHRPDWALYEVPFLWLSVLAPIVALRRYAANAAWLLVPYLVWVAIAAALNAGTVRLNGPSAREGLGVSGLFEIAALIDLVIALTLIEGAVLAWWHRRRGEGVAPRRFVPSMVAGLCLMLALRSHVHDAGTTTVAFYLLAAGVAHAADILRGWHRRVPADEAKA